MPIHVFLGLMAIVMGAAALTVWAVIGLGLPFAALSLLAVLASAAFWWRR